jgi:hypothetical protein
MLSKVVAFAAAVSLFLPLEKNRKITKEEKYQQP